MMQRYSPFPANELQTKNAAKAINRGGVRYKAL
jgi:hypothetical protein